MFCPKCRRSVQNGASFCPFCGNEVEMLVSATTSTSEANRTDPIICPKCGANNYSFITKKNLKICVCNSCGKEYLTKDDTVTLIKALPRFALFCSIGFLIMVPCVLWSIGFFIDDYSFEWSDMIIPGLLAIIALLSAIFSTQYIIKSKGPWDYNLETIMNKDDISKSSRYRIISIVLLIVGVCILIFGQSFKSSIDYNNSHIEGADGYAQTQSSEIYTDIDLPDNVISLKEIAAAYLSNSLKANQAYGNQFQNVYGNIYVIDSLYDGIVRVWLLTYEPSVFYAYCDFNESDSSLYDLSVGQNVIISGYLDADASSSSSITLTNATVYGEDRNSFNQASPDSSTTMYSQVDKYLGDWEDDTGRLIQMTISDYPMDGYYSVEINWWVGTRYCLTWTYDAEYNAQGGTLYCYLGSKSGWNNIDYETEVYYEEAGEALLYFGDDGFLYWSNSTDDMTEYDIYSDVPFYKVE